MRSLSTTLGSTAQGIWMGKMCPHNIWLCKPMGLYVQASCRAVETETLLLKCTQSHSLQVPAERQQFENCQSYTRMRCLLISGHVPHVQDSVRMFSGHRNTGGYHLFLSFPFYLAGPMLSSTIFDTIHLLCWHCSPHPRIPLGTNPTQSAHIAQGPCEVACGQSTSSGFTWTAWS